MTPEIKKKLIAECLRLLNAKISTIDDELDILQKAANEETKSSAGDKYETGRAMMMLEKEKFLHQKAQLSDQLKPLRSVNIEKKFTKVETGAIVGASGINYFIATGLGKVEVEGSDFFVLSAAAPIAKAMLNKGIEDEFLFNGKKNRITHLM